MEDLLANPLTAALSRRERGLSRARFRLGGAKLLPVDPQLAHAARKVCGLIFKSRAAPCGPSMRPAVAASAASMCRRMAASSETMPEGSAGPGGAGGRGPPVPGEETMGVAAMPRAGAISSRLPSPRIAARSITVANSRTFPGQG